MTRTSYRTKPCWKQRTAVQLNQNYLFNKNSVLQYFLFKDSAFPVRPITRLVLRPRLTPRDTSYFNYVLKASGKNALFLSMYLPHLPFGFPSRYRISVCLEAVSIPNWPHTISVRQVRDLPAPSFRFHLTMLPLVFGCDVPTTMSV